MKTTDLVPTLIEWYDAFGIHDGWTDLKDAKSKPRKIVSVGLLLPDAVEDYYTLVGSYDDTAQTFNGGIHIPKVNVTKMKSLR